LNGWILQLDEGREWPMEANYRRTGEGIVKDDG
jgi:hypothetical protein